MAKTIDGKFIFTHKGEDYVSLNDYVKLLQEKEDLKEKINTYENPEDLTLMFMYCDEKAKDKIKELKEMHKTMTKYALENEVKIDKLQQENQQLKEELEKYKYALKVLEDTKPYKKIFEMSGVVQERDLYKEVIKEVSEYIKDSCYYPELENYSNMTSEEVKELLQILDKVKGE